jgi:hypothetical protein
MTQTNTVDETKIEYIVTSWQVTTYDIETFAEALVKWTNQILFYK